MYTHSTYTQTLLPPETVHRLATEAQQYQINSYKSGATDHLAAAVFEKLYAYEAAVEANAKADAK